MPPKRKAESKSASSKKAKIDESMDSDEDSGTKAKVTIKGGAAVDKHYPQASNYHVYSDASGVWDFTGNQTNIKSNNNKFYIIQLLESDKTPKTYKTWTRWGRLGATGQNSVLGGPDLASAQAAFRKKFKDKTKNDWANKDNFVAVKGKYDMVAIDYGADVEEEEMEIAEAFKAKKKAPAAKSKLDPALKSLTDLIFDVKAMTATVTEMEYDIKKMPLGKLTHDQISRGYQALRRIEDVLEKKKKGDLADLSSRFYTLIPHVFGMKRPPTINSAAMLKQKMALLDALNDIKTAFKIMDSKGDSEIHISDKNYQSLSCGLETIPKGTGTYKMVQTYLKNTHGKTHKQYDLELLDLFEATKEQPFDDSMGNTALLWHGSRLTNWVGILGQGLRIAPPEAPCTGYMFGKGVYFADMASKSANYCFTSRSNDVGLLLLCEVALGNQNKRFDADCYLHDHQPAGTHSTFGIGQNMPDPKQDIVVDGVKVPLGTPILTGAKNPSGGYTLAYNEFIVYDTSQVRFKYLLKVKFNYKK